MTKVLLELKSPCAQMTVGSESSSWGTRCPPGLWTPSLLSSPYLCHTLGEGEAASGSPASFQKLPVFLPHRTDLGPWPPSPMGGLIPNFNRPPRPPAALCSRVKSDAWLTGPLTFHGHTASLRERGLGEAQGREREDEGAASAGRDQHSGEARGLRPWGDGEKVGWAS